MNLAVGTRLGAYELRPLEGRGATADVYRAIDTSLGREVALKILPGTDTADGHALKRLQREARMLAALDHPNIARLHGLEECEGIHLLVLELVEGPTLADLIAQGPLPVVEALGIARQVAAALDSAHDRGIIHRDLKPSNIKIRSDGTAKILDFGLAKMVRDSTVDRELCSPTITAEGAAVGTAAYMSPEQARGGRVNERSDIWAFGCVIYEMLTGARAFRGEDTASTLASVLRSEPDWSLVPAAVPPTIQAFLRGCLRKDPAERVRHIGDVGLALAGAFDPPDVPAKRPSAGQRLLSRRRPLVWITAAIIAGGGAAVAMRWPHERRQDPTSYVIQPPSGTSFGRLTMDPWPALSPDGRSIAFVTSSPSGPGAWLQRLGELVPRRVPGVERLGVPFWSADSRSVGFAGEDGLKTLAVAGSSAPQLLCSCRAVGGATWGRDGTILFSHETGLSRVAASGGAATAVTQIVEAHGEFAHRYPMFLPDGRYFVYLVRSSDGERRGIYLASLDDPTHARRLVATDSNAAIGVGPDDRPYLLFVRDGDLLAQWLDVARGRLTGAPIVMARRVIPGETGRFAPFAAGGRALIFRETGPSESRLLWVNRRGIPQETDLSQSDRLFRFPSLSPDGKRLAVAQADPRTARLDVWLYDLQRRVSERLTTDPLGAFFPVWTPDGDRIIYSSAREGPWNLFWRASGRPDEGRVYAAPTPTNKYPTDITPDGQYLLFQEAEDRPAVWMLPLSGDRPAVRLLTGTQARVSPNGRWLAYTSTETGRREVYVTAFPIPQARRRVSTGGGEDPHWRGDSRELFFLDASQMLTAAAIGSTARFEVGALQPLFRVLVSHARATDSPAYAPAPDGQRFLINERVRDEEMVLTAIENWTSDER